MARLNRLRCFAVEGAGGTKALLTRVARNVCGIAAAHVSVKQVCKGNQAHGIMPLPDGILDMDVM